jgi:hypothetical protein
VLHRGLLQTQRLFVRHRRVLGSSSNSRRNRQRGRGLLDEQLNVGLVIGLSLGLFVPEGILGLRGIYPNHSTLCRPIELLEGNVHAFAAIPAAELNGRAVQTRVFQTLPCIPTLPKANECGMSSHIHADK